MGSPAMPLKTLWAAITAISVRVLLVAEPICGETTAMEKKEKKFYC